MERCTKLIEAGSASGFVTSNSRPFELPFHDSSAVRYVPHGVQRDASPLAKPCVPSGTIVTDWPVVRSSRFTPAVPVSYGENM